MQKNRQKTQYSRVKNSYFKRYYFCVAYRTFYKDIREKKYPPYFFDIMIEEQKEKARLKKEKLRAKNKKKNDLRKKWRKLSPFLQQRRNLRRNV